MYEYITKKSIIYKFKYPIGCGMIFYKIILIHTDKLTKYEKKRKENETRIF